MLRSLFRPATALWALASLLLSLGTARAAGVEEFYKDRTVSLVIGYSVGGGYDTYARLLAQHMGKHIPGNPSVVPQNMPGAGSLKAANYLYAVPPTDGPASDPVARALPMEPLLGGPKLRA